MLAQLMTTSRWSAAAPPGLPPRSRWREPVPAPHWSPAARPMPTTGPRRCSAPRSISSNGSTSGRAAATRRRRLQTMRLVDDTGRLIRAPEVRFSSARNRPRGIRLQHRKPRADDGAGSARRRAAQPAAVRRRSRDRCAGRRRGRDPHPRRATLCPRASWSAPTAGTRCAGRPPVSRSGGAISIRSALTFNIAHSRPHQNISTEFHTAAWSRACSCRCPAIAAAWCGWLRRRKPSG